MVNPLPTLEPNPDGVCRFRHEGDHYRLTFILPRDVELASREVKTWGILRGEDPVLLERSSYGSETGDPSVFLRDSDFPLYDGFAVTASGLSSQQGILLATVRTGKAPAEENRLPGSSAETRYVTWSDVDASGDLVPRFFSVPAGESPDLGLQNSLLTWTIP